MKNLTLVRHAAAVQDATYRDYDRPLRKKGLEKASFNTAQIVNRGYRPDLLVSSPAARALQTAEIFVAESGYGLKKEDIVTAEVLYLPSAEEIITYLKLIQDRYDDVFLFSHNNGISWAAQALCNEPGIIMPTGAVIRIELDIKSWKDTGFGCGNMLDFIP